MTIGPITVGAPPPRNLRRLDLWRAVKEIPAGSYRDLDFSRTIQNNVYRISSSLKFSITTRKLNGYLRVYRIK